MTDSGRTDPFTEMISLVAGPIAAVIRSFDQLRRGAEELMRGLENFNSTMENLNETAARINRLLNDFEEPVRAMLPQMTRTVRAAEELSARLAAPLDQVVPGLSRLAETLNSPVLAALPTDLGQLMNVINDLARRMSPLAQIAEQAGGLFGLRVPGFPRPTAAAPAPPSPAPPPPAPPMMTAATRKTATARRQTVTKQAATPRKKKAATRQAATPRKAATKTKRATAKKAAGGR